MTLHLPSDKKQKHEMTIREYRRKLFWKTVMWNLMFGFSACAAMFGIAAVISGEETSLITCGISLLLIPITMEIAIHLSDETDLHRWRKK